MLLQFTAENFLSFRDKVVFSMRASSDKDHPGHVVAGKVPLLRGAAVYGANAAGKSNLVLAMGFARDLIAPRGRAASGLAALRPFGLRENAGRVSTFAWHFVHDGKVWNYGFSLTNERVVEEYLFARDESGGREKKWFERATDEDGATTVSFGDDFLGPKSQSDGQLLKLIGPRTPEAELFLRFCRLNKIAAVEPVFEWFEDILLIVRAEADYEPLVLEANEDEQFLRFLSDQVRDAGTGIDAIEKLEIPVTDETLASSSDEAKQKANEILAALSPGETTLKLDKHNRADPWSLFRRGMSEELIFISLRALHRTPEGMLLAFWPEQESEGTQRYLHLLPRLYQLQTRPTVLVIDELERRLHTLLTRRLVEQALQSPQPRSQFIFTTHDTNLLDSDLLRRDEIWFVDKDAGGASSLSSLAEYKIRSDSDYEKGYLLGRFEGIPYFRRSHRAAPADTEHTEPDAAREALQS
jgi:AAA15 family ATPase/GTPase